MAGLVGTSGILMLVGSNSAQASSTYSWRVVLGSADDHICCGLDHERYATSPEVFPIGTILTLQTVTLSGDTTACANEGWNAQVDFPYDQDAEAEDSSNFGFQRPRLSWNGDSTNLSLASPTYEYEGLNGGSYPADPFITHVTGSAQSIYVRAACGPTGFSGDVIFDVQVTVELPASDPVPSSSTVVETSTSVVADSTTSTVVQSSSASTTSVASGPALGNTVNLPVTGGSSNTTFAVALTVFGFGSAIGIRRWLLRRN